MTSSGPAPSHAPPNDHFVTTLWTVVLSAGHKTSPQSDSALATLCQVYWYPLYAYVRRRGYTKEDAEDLVQAFFARFLEKDYLNQLSPERGRFRAFLLACLKHFLSNEWDKASRQKRGGGVQHLSLDWQSADESYHLDPPDSSSPELAFDRAWALALLERVITRLREECATQNKMPLFEQAKGYLMVGEARIPYAQAAQALHVGEGAIRIAVHRFRKRYRQLLREEISQTVSDPASVDEELGSLRAALQSL